MTAEQIAAQLEIERGILEVLLQGTNLRPGTDNSEGIRVYPDWLYGQQNRVRALEIMLEEAMLKQRVARGSGERKVHL